MMQDELMCDNGYCPNCDTSAYVEVPIEIDRYFFRYSCGMCGAIDSKIHLTEYAWEFRQYLLSNSEYDEGLFLLYDGSYI